MRRALFALAGLTVLTVVLHYAVGFLTLDNLRPVLEQRLSTALGRDVRIEGDFHLDVLPRVRLEASRVVVENVPGRVSPVLLSVETLHLDLAPLPLIRGALEIDGLNVWNADLRLETDTEGHLGLEPDADAFTADPAPDDAEFQVRVAELRAFDTRVSYLRAGDDAPTTLQLDLLELESTGRGEPIDWVARGYVRGGHFDARGQIGAIPELLSPTSPYPVSLSGAVLGATVSLAGSVARPLGLEGIDVRASVDLPDVQHLWLEPGPGLSRLGPIRLSGRLRNPNGELGVEELEVATVGESRLRGRVTGRIERLLELKGVDVDVELESDSIDFVAPLLGLALPDAEAVAKVRVEDGDGTLGVSGNLKLSRSDGTLAVDVDGDYGDLQSVDAIRLTVRGEARDLRVLSRLIEARFDFEPPPLGPLRVSGEVHGARGRFSVRDLDAELGRRDKSWASLRGRVGDVAELRGVELEADFGSSTVGQLGRDLRAARGLSVPRELPEIGPFEGRAHFTDSDGSLGIEQLYLKGGVESEFSIDLEGEFDDVREVDEISLRTTLSARDLETLGSLFDVELPPIGPVVFSGQVAGSDERLVSTGSVRLNQTHLEGGWTGSFAGGDRPRIDVGVTSPHLYLEDIGFGGQLAGPVRPEGVSVRSEELPFDRLRELDGTLALSAERVSGYAGLEVRSVKSHLELEDGDLRVTDTGMTWEGGAVVARLRVDARTRDPALSLHVDTDGADLAGVGAQFGLGEETGGGTLDASVVLTTGGRTFQDLRSRLAGDGAFAVRDWSVGSTYARRFVLSLASAFLPTSRDVDVERFGCFASAAWIDDGVARVEDFVIEAERVRVLGSGTVDLARGEYDLQLQPIVREPGLLSIAAAVRVTGPLDDPSFSPIPLQIASNTVRGLFRNAMRPARMLMRPLRGRGEEVDPARACDDLVPAHVADRAAGGSGAGS